MARTVEQIRADMTKDNPTCPECGEPTYKKLYVGSDEVYYSCSANRCRFTFDVSGEKRPIGLSALIRWAEPT